MSSRVIQICNTIVSEITGGSWTIGTVAAERTYRPRVRAADVVTPKVFVVPVTRETEVETRGASDRREHGVALGVFRFCPGPKATRDTLVDQAVELVDELEEYFLKRPIAVGSVNVLPIGAAVDPVFDPEVLDTEGVFASVLTLSIWDHY